MPRFIDAVTVDNADRHLCVVCLLQLSGEEGDFSDLFTGVEKSKLLIAVLITPAV